MLETTELAAKLRVQGEKFVDFFGGLSDQQWKIEVYTDGAVWTIRSILAHLMTTERALVRLFENFRQGGSGVSEDFEIDRFNARQQEKTKDLGPQELLAQYKAERNSMIAWASRLSAAELDKMGRHPFLGVTSLRDMIKMVYIHNQTHYRDLKKVFG